MVLVERGTITQLMIGTIFCLVFLLLQVRLGTVLMLPMCSRPCPRLPTTLSQMQAGPYKDTADDFIANSASFSLAVVYLCSLMFKVATLTEMEEVLERISLEQRADYYVPSVTISWILLTAVVGALLLSFGLLLAQLARERTAMARELKSRKARRLRNKRTHEEVMVPPIPDEPKRHFHIFLSHVWGTGQDQMRIVKQRLLEMMPDLHCFLDVDDLEEIGDLEGYIDRTSVVLIYCSSGYFVSKNCMRELVSSTVKKKPIIALIDTDASRGGLTLEQVHANLIAGESSYDKWGFDPKATPTGQVMYDHLFQDEPIEWNRKLPQLSSNSPVMPPAF